MNEIIEMFQGLIMGFGIAFSWTNLLFALIGALLGTIVGILPGLGPAATISLLLPVSLLIPISVALEKGDPAIPDVPTFRELGYNVVSVGSVKGVAAPKGTPPDVIAYLADRFKKVCDDPEFVKSMKDIGQPVMYLGPDDFGKYLKQGYEKFGKLIKEFNIKLE